MHGHNNPPPDGSATGPAAPIARLEVLVGHFSNDEIVRLIRLQVRLRRRPDGFDVPLAVSRLRFARWLFEHGYIGEGLEADAELAAQPPPGATPAQTRRIASPKHEPLQYSDPQLARPGTPRRRDAAGPHPLVDVAVRAVTRLGALLVALRAWESQFRQPDGPYRGRSSVRIDPWRSWPYIY